MKARPVDEAEFLALRATAGDYAGPRALAVPNMVAFSAGEAYSAESLHHECMVAAFALRCTGMVKPDIDDDARMALLPRMDLLEHYARAEVNRRQYRNRVAIAIEELANWGEPLDAIRTLVDHAFARGTGQRP